MSAGNSIVYYMGSTTQTLSLTESTVTLDTTSQIDTDTYSVSSGVITVKEAGTYLVINHLAVDRIAGTNSNRTSGESFLHVNNTLVAGAYTDGYIRRNSGDDEFSDCAYGIYEFAANDEVEMRQKRINLVGSDARIVGNVTTYIDAKTSLTLIKLNDDNAKIILEATAAENQTLTADNTYVDMNWDDEIVKDSGFTHSESTNPDEITIDAAGKYLAVYSNSWYRTVSSSTRTGAYEVLDLDGSIIPGSFKNNYIRGTQSSEQIMRGNNSAMVLFETTSANQKIKLKSSREAGSITLTRYPLQSRLAIYKLNGDEKTFRIESSSTENIGSTTESTMTYDSSDWIDTGFSLASNQITVTDGSKLLLMQGVQAISNVTARSGSYQFGRYNGVNNKYGTGAKYSRDTAGCDMICPHWASIQSISDTQKIECRMKSLNANTTGALRQANTGAFCGIDLATLASATPEAGAQTSVEIDIEGSGQKINGRGGETTVEVDTEGAGAKIVSKGAETSIEVSVQGSGTRIVSKGAEASIEVDVSAGGAGEGDDLKVDGNADTSASYQSWSPYIGQIFDSGMGGTLTKVHFYLSKSADATGTTVRAVLFAAQGTGTYGTDLKPSGSILAASATINIADIPTWTTFSGFDFEFTDEYELDADTYYGIMLDVSNLTAGSVYEGCDSDGSGHDGNRAYYVSPDWYANTARATSFEVWVTNGLEIIDEYDFDNRNTGYVLYDGNAKARAQSFKPTENVSVSYAAVLCRLSGSPTGNAYAKIFAHSGTFGTSSIATGTALATSNAVDVSTFTDNYETTYFEFETPYELTANTPYVLAISYESGGSSDYIMVGCDTATYTHEGNYCYLWATDIWYAVAARDMPFIVYTDADGAGGLKIGNGGAETTVETDVEGSGQPLKQAGGETEIDVSVEGVGEKIGGVTEDGAETTVEIDAEGAGQRIISDGAETSVDVNVEGAGTKTHSKGAETTANVTVEGSGVHISEGGADTNISVDVQGAGLKIISDNGETSVNVDVEGAGERSVERGAETSVNISVEGAGLKIAASGAEVGNIIDVEGSGQKINEAGADTNITIAVEGVGEKTIGAGGEVEISVAVEGAGEVTIAKGAETGVEISVEGAGTKSIENDAETAVNVSVEGAGEKIVTNVAETGVNISVQGAGQKTVDAGAQTEVEISVEGEGYKVGQEAGAETGISISVEGSGVKIVARGTSSSVEISVESAGLKINDNGAETAIDIDTQATGLRLLEDGAEATTEISVEGSGLKILPAGAEASIDVEVEGSGVKTVNRGTSATVEVDVEGAGVKIGDIPADGASTNIGVSAEGAGVKIVSIGAQTGNIITAEGSGENIKEDGASAGVSVDADGAGVRHFSDAAETQIDADIEGAGFKIVAAGAETEIGAGTEGGAYPFKEAGAAALVLILVEGAGTAYYPSISRPHLGIGKPGLPGRAEPGRCRAGLPNRPNINKEETP